MMKNIKANPLTGRRNFTTDPAFRWRDEITARRFWKTAARGLPLDGIIEEDRLSPARCRARFCPLPFPGVMRHQQKTKLNLGKRALLSATIQVSASLRSRYEGTIEILKMSPKWTEGGNKIVVKFRVGDPQRIILAVFAMQRIGDCLDLWLESSQATETCADGGVSR